jgi:excisionase family DNA binding protein
MTDRLTLTIAEAAELLGISRNSAYEAARRGELPTIRLGRRLLVPKRRLERMLDAESESTSSS